MCEKQVFHPIGSREVWLTPREANIIAHGLCQIRDQIDNFLAEHNVTSHEIDYLRGKVLGIHKPRTEEPLTR